MKSLLNIAKPHVIGHENCILNEGDWFWSTRNMGTGPWQITKITEKHVNIVYSPQWKPGEGMFQQIKRDLQPNWFVKVKELNEQNPHGSLFSS